MGLSHERYVGLLSISLQSSRCSIELVRLPVCLPATPRHAPGLGSRKTSKPALVSTSCHISIQQPRAYIAERPRFIHTYIEKGGKWLVAPYVRAAEPPRPRQGGVSPTSVFGRSVGRSVAVPRSGERTTYLPHTLSLFLSLSRTYTNTSPLSSFSYVGLL